MTFAKLKKEKDLIKMVEKIEEKEERIRSIVDEGREYHLDELIDKIGREFVIETLVNNLGDNITGMYDNKEDIIKQITKQKEQNL